MIRPSSDLPTIESSEVSTIAARRVATAPALEGRSGLYFDGLRETRPNAQAYDRAARAKLRALSLELTGLAA